MDFNTFAFSLGSSAFIHLGETSNPETGKTEINLILAKETIDILGMLQEKTRGNLTEEEGRFLEGLLYDLRMRYIERQKPGTPDAAKAAGDPAAGPPAEE